MFYLSHNLDSCTSLQQSRHSQKSLLLRLYFEYAPTFSSCVKSMLSKPLTICRNIKHAFCHDGHSYPWICFLNKMSAEVFTPSVEKKIGTRWFSMKIVNE